MFFSDNYDQVRELRRNTSSRFRLSTNSAEAKLLGLQGGLATQKF
jgi:hypothetical protein